MDIFEEDMDVLEDQYLLHLLLQTVKVMNGINNF